MLASCSQHRESFISDHRADIRLLAGSSGLGSSQLATSVLGAELLLDFVCPCSGRVPPIPSTFSWSFSFLPLQPPLFLTCLFKKKHKGTTAPSARYKTFGISLV